MKKINLMFASFCSAFLCMININAQVVTTFAGSGASGNTDATGTAASFKYPTGVCTDALGNIYVADQSNHKIRKISPAGVVTTFAGSGSQGNTDATGTAASFRYPTGVCADASGNIYVADYLNNEIREISPAGVVTTFAGSGTVGSTDATGTAASFKNPTGVCADVSGNIYVADLANHKIRKISPAGVVTTFAGSGTAGSTDATGTAASFNGPAAVCMDASGNIYVTEQYGNKIRKISPAGVVTTVAGSGAAGSIDATGTAARFHFPTGICADPSGNMYVADQYNHKIRKISPAGVVTTFAGSGTGGNTDATGTAASFYYPSGVCIDSSGNMYVADLANNKIRAISLPPASALNFDGVNDQVSFGNSINSILDPLNTITVEAWVNPANTTFNGVIAGNYHSPNTEMQFLLRRDYDSYSFWVDDGTGFKTVNSGPATVVLNTWQHVAGVWDGSKLYIYINGVLISTTSGVTGSSFASTGNAFVIGSNSYPEPFTGSIDEVRLWSVARTKCEINTYMNCEIPSAATGLLANYHFNQGYPNFNNSTVTTLNDASGNSNTGTLSNFALSGSTSNWVAPGAVANGYTTTTITTPTITVNSGSICSGQSFTMLPSGAVTYTYSSGSAVVTPTSNATYSVTGTDVNGCVSSTDAIASVTVNALPTITVNSGTICAGQSFTMVPGGAVTYTYSSGTDIVTPTVDATYSVSGTDVNGCVSSTDAIASVTVNALPTITVNSGAICAGQSFTMVPGGAVTYTYSSGTDVVTPTADATYSVSGTDVNGCVSSTDAIASVTVNALPTITVNSGTICAGQSFTMVPGSAVTYTYSSGTAVVTPTADATYSVSGTDVNGCVSSTDAIASVTVNALPTITVNSGAICAGQSFTMVPGGAVTYTYSSGTDAVTPTADATYSVSGTDVNGCMSSTDAIASVTVNALPTITVNSGSICAGQSFTMVPGGAVTYTYSSGTDVVTPTADATYSVSGTDINGCISSTAAVSSVTVNALPTVMASTNTILLCTGQTATLSATGATSYTWSTTETTTNIAVTPNSTAVYTVTGVDANGCVNTTTVQQNVSLCTGIVSLTVNTTSVYPNPNNGLFMIDLNSVSQVSITNALGQVIMTETMEVGAKSLNIQDQPAGVYFVKVIQQDKQQIIRLIKE